MTYEEITQLDIISLKYTDKHGIKDKMEKMEFVAATDLKYLLMAYDITNSMQRPIIIQNQLKEKITIYEHQIRAVSMVKNLFNGRVLLADEVGLGKTIEAGILIKEYFAIGLIHNALILTPPSLTQQWKEELGTKFELSFINHKDEEFEGPNQHNRLIMSLDTAKSDKNMKLLSSKEWDLVVVDEAHRIRNAKTKAHKAVAKLDTKYLFLLSATPMQNNLRELYNLVKTSSPLY